MALGIRCKDDASTGWKDWIRFIGGNDSGSATDVYAGIRYDFRRYDYRFWRRITYFDIHLDVLAYDRIMCDDLRYYLQILQCNHCI